jgi:hypothetical protein
MIFLKTIIDKVVSFFVRRRWLYMTIGAGAFVFLSSELITVDIRDYFQIDFNELNEKYGQELTAIIAYFVNKLAGGYDRFAVGVYLLLILVCLYIDFRVQTKDGKNSIWNIFLGVKQNINQTYNMKDDE